jgi:hypothetical protein
MTGLEPATFTATMQHSTIKLHPPIINFVWVFYYAHASRSLRLIDIFFEYKPLFGFFLLRLRGAIKIFFRYVYQLLPKSFVVLLLNHWRWTRSSKGPAIYSWLKIFFLFTLRASLTIFINISIYISINISISISIYIYNKHLIVYYK